MSEHATMTTTGAGHAVTIRPHPRGSEWGTVMESNDPWYRYLRAVAELYIAGEIDTDQMGDSAMFARLDGNKDRPLSCPAAQRLAGQMIGAWAEPPCVCWAYQDGPPCIRQCVQVTEDDRREHLRDLMGL